MKITNKIIKTLPVKWREFSFMQTEDFKELIPEAAARLRESMLSNNFVEAFNVWEDSDGTIYCLDGFHRCGMLERFISEGIEVPDELPANFIDCPNKKEAAKLVLIYSSIYAKITQQGFTQYIEQHEINLEDVQFQMDLPEFTLPKAIEEIPAEDHTPEEPSSFTSVVVFGDHFRLGNHYILCGDASSSDDVLKLMGGNRAAGIVTSPPYAEQRKNQYGGIPVMEYEDWFMGIQSNARLVLSGEGSFFLNIKPHCEDGQRHLYVHDLVAAMVRRFDWKFIEEYVWTHQGYPGALPGRFKNQFEPVFHFGLLKGSEVKFRPENVLLELSDAHYERLSLTKSGKARSSRKDFKSASGMGNMSNYRELEGARPGNVIHAPLGESSSNHPAPFPLALPTFFIKGFSDEGDAWYEPFNGSGTTLIACEATKRRCFGMDLQPEYIEITIRRWVRWCDKLGITPDFEHLNGSLTLEQIIQND